MAPAATAEPPAMEPAPVSSSQEVRRQEDLDTPAGSTPETSVRLEASTPPNPGLEEAGADLAAPRERGWWDQAVCLQLRKHVRKIQEKRWMTTR